MLPFPKTVTAFGWMKKACNSQPPDWPGNGEAGRTGRWMWHLSLAALMVLTQSSDKAVMIFNTKDYKLPKGITFEYDASISQKTKEKKPLSKQGRIEISYASYEINKGLAADIFGTK